jgi:hypothetical protein
MQAIASIADLVTSHNEVFGIPEDDIAAFIDFVVLDSDPVAEPNPDGIAAAWYV